MTARFIVGDALSVMRSMPAGSVDLVLTSPPFLALRSYLSPDHPDKALEMGSEATPAEYLDALLDVTEEWARVLAPHGSICVELGDTYAGSGGAGGDYAENGLREGQERWDGSASRAYGTGAAPRPARVGRGRPDRRADEAVGIIERRNGRKAQVPGWPLDKSLCGIPSLYANSLAYGRNLLRPERTTGPWRVRNLVAWVRPNPPVGALGDKYRPATSYLTIATKARDRWFDLDAVRTAPSPNTHKRLAEGAAGRHDLPSQQRDGNWHTLEANDWTNPAGAPPLDWWRIPPKGYSGAHYAVFPPELCRIPVDSMCPRRVCRACGEPSRREAEASDAYARHTGADMFHRLANKGASPGDRAIGRHGGSRPNGLVSAEYTTTGWTTCGCPGADGIRLDGFHAGTGWRPGLVLDPFAGSGTTLMVATGMGRSAVGVDLDARNADLARERVGMWLEVEAMLLERAIGSLA